LKEKKVAPEQRRMISARHLQEAEMKKFKVSVLILRVIRKKTHAGLKNTVFIHRGTPGRNAFHLQGALGMKISHDRDHIPGLETLAPQKPATLVMDIHQFRGMVGGKGIILRPAFNFADDRDALMIPFFLDMHMNLSCFINYSEEHSVKPYIISGPD
jgi:hypothetical protein